ncbi:unnamed protein product [Medioppia subpectinata]|uniref:Uncharacterized protein n=1 Tax=Medioppia subpectinata TaxID=1979941 RepID=A0A7R9KTU3_9ACAR|nr:unnamed protein product [Medioppia subpectinata]CAG2108323.1 unnamed protein product [Medioppia subpectinata]
MSYDFSGKVVLITGSSAGIGAATAVGFARSGAQVVVTGRNGQRISAVGKQCSDVSPNGLTALEVTADVSKEVDCKQLIDSTVKAFHRLDVLVNNAGYGLSAGITDSQFGQKLDDMFAANVKSATLLTQLSVEHLTKTNGNIINISSISATQATPKLSGYCMTKSALDMFTKCMAVELGPKGIRVNTVSPGAVRTTARATRGEAPEDTDRFYQKVSDRYPVGRHGVPEDIGNVIMYLASKQPEAYDSIKLVCEALKGAKNKLEVVIGLKKCLIEMKKLFTEMAQLPQYVLSCVESEMIAADNT